MLDDIGHNASVPLQLVVHYLNLCQSRKNILLLLDWLDRFSRLCRRRFVLCRLEELLDLSAHSQFLVCCKILVILLVHPQHNVGVRLDSVMLPVEVRKVVEAFQSCIKPLERCQTVLLVLMVVVDILQFLDTVGLELVQARLGSMIS